MRKASRVAVAMIAASVVVPFIAVTTAAAGQVATGPDGGTAGTAWAAAEDGPQQYPNVSIDWDVPIRMSDGVVLKGNVYRPADANGRPIETPTPTIVNFTPYTKLLSNVVDSAQSIPVLSDALLDILRQVDFSGTALSGVTDLTKAYGRGVLRSFFGVDRQLIKGGYTEVVVDVRGTGFSQGEWGVLDAREQQDTTEVIDWVTNQSWADGKVGMNGLSYAGVTQVQAAEHNPPALKAIFPVVPGNDLIDDVLNPGGGGFPPLFYLPWLMGVNALKWIPDVQSILAGRFDQQWLQDRIGAPASFLQALLSAYTSPRLEDLDPKTRDLLTDSSAIRQGVLGDPSKIQAPTFIVGGWHDLFQYSQPKIYNQIPLPPGQKQLLMGNTYHVNSGSESGAPGLPPRLDVLQRAWFDHWLKGIDNGIETYGPVTLREQGGGWITTSGFGPSAPAEDAGTYRRMYLSASRSGTANSAYDGSLTGQGTNDTDRLTIAPGLTTICSNDTAESSTGAAAIIVGCATDSRIAELNALTFTSTPVAGETTISGPLAVHLNTVQDAADGYWTVTVNDVAPDGRSTVLSSGQLMASLRQIDEERSSRSANGDYIDPRPYVSLDKRQPTVPGQPTTLDITMPATRAVLAPGHRLRLDVFAGNFPKGLPAFPLLLDTGFKPEHVQLDPGAPSFVNLPVRGDSGW
ncbi:CocE/NonD family hydrolase [Nocardia sp. NPDC088792]|uniref:CocE/NonD family hydrolase n=1 Tax=Nocardia sp. NPDC088792 TaxID=3364332 RepID=UPI00380842A6